MILEPYLRFLDTTVLAGCNSYQSPLLIWTSGFVLGILIGYLLATMWPESYDHFASKLELASAWIYYLDGMSAVAPEPTDLHALNKILAAARDHPKWSEFIKTYRRNA